VIRVMSVVASCWALGMASCAAEESQPGVVVQDSAGVVIVESFEPAWADGDGWVVAASPLVDLAQAGEGPTYEFFGGLRPNRRRARGCLVRTRVKRGQVQQ
jgi:hypothetical protein